MISHFPTAGIEICFVGRISSLASVLLVPARRSFATGHWIALIQEGVKRVAHGTGFRISVA